MTHGPSGGPVRQVPELSCCKAPADHPVSMMTCCISQRSQVQASSCLCRCNALQLQTAQCACAPARAAVPLHNHLCYSDMYRPVFTHDTFQAANCATAVAAMANWPTQKLLVLPGPKLVPGAAPTGWQLPTVPSACKDTVVRHPQDFCTSGMNTAGSKRPAEMPYAMAYVNRAVPVVSGVGLYSAKQQQQQHIQHNVESIHGPEAACMQVIHTTNACYSCVNKPL